MDGRRAVFACFVASCAFLAYLYAVVAPARELPILKVTATPRMAFSPTAIEVIVIAKPDERNRYLAVSIGAADSLFAGSSQRSLRGEEEDGQVANLTYPKVPAGTYLVVAALYDRDGKMLARETADVKRISRVE